jgi:putative membrane protein
MSALLGDSGVATIVALHPLTGLELERALAWTWDPWGLLAVLPVSLVYALGLRNLWRHAGVGGAVRVWRAECFALGAVVLALALLSPLDALSEVRFAAHMSQHELLMVVAAPLMVLGRPGLVAVWALPAPWRLRTSTVLAAPSVRVAKAAASAPFFVIMLHALARWVWHLPVLFEAAMRSDALHAFQHLTFFGTAALFWYAVVAGRFGRAGYGAGLLFVFFTAFHTTLLAALLTLSPRGLYPIYAERGLDPTELVEDQALGGVLMWVPSGVALLVIALALLAAWLGEAERRALQRERAATARNQPSFDAQSRAPSTEEPA